MRIRLSVVRRLAAALIMGGLLSLPAHAAGIKSGGAFDITDDLIGGSAGTVQASGGNFVLDGSLGQVATSSSIYTAFPFPIIEAGYFSMMTTTPVNSSFPAVSSKTVTVAWVVSNPTGTLYMIDASTAADFTGTIFSSAVYNSSYTTIPGLRSNTVYNFRYKANYMEGDETDFHSLGSFATLANMPTGCAAGSGFNVAKDGYADFTTIQAAVDALPVSLVGTACVVIRDTQTYTEAVTIGNFTNNGFAIKIIADPSFVSSAPVVNTPGGINPSFTINTATVTLGHITILPTANIPYGVFASSDYVTLSSVSVGDSGTTITVAAISLSSWSTVYRSTSQSDGNSLILNGHNNLIYGSTIAGNSGTTGLRILGSSNTVTQSFVTGTNGSALLIGGGYNTISQSSVSAVGGVFSVIAVDGVGATRNTLTQNSITNFGGGPGSASLLLTNGASFNTISQSSVAASSGGRAVWINSTAGSNTVTASRLTSVAATATMEIANASGNTVSYTTVTNTGIAVGAAFYINTATGNAILHSKMTGNTGYGMHLYLSSYNVVQLSSITAATANVLLLQSGFANQFDRVVITGGNTTPVYIYQSSSDTIRQSTITASGAASAILDLDGASSITISQCYLSGASAMGVRFGNQSNYNVLSQSSVSVSGSGLPGLRASGSSSSNTITQSFIGSTSGSGVQFFGGGFNTISGSTIVCQSGNATDYGLNMVTSSLNTVTQTFISRSGASSPRGVYIENESNGNSIISSSITAFNDGITFYQTSSNTIVASYVQGSTAVIVFGSTGTRISYSRLNASAGAGNTLTFSGGSNGLTLSSSTLTGGQFGIGVYSDNFNGGAIVVLNNYITSGYCSVCLTTTTAGSTVWVTSNTMSPTPSPSGGFGVLLDGLQYGATIQNNNIYFRAAGSGTSSRGMALFSSRGLVIERNRINQPGILTAGNYTAVKFFDVIESEFRFNDVHSSGTVPVAYMLDLYNSTVAVRNNIFMSSMTATPVTIVASANSGVDFDYNNYYSSSTPVILNWGGIDYQFPWSAAVGADAHSINGNPLWAKTDSGAEDFHPKSTVGRYNPATGLFVIDAVDSPTLDYADPLEAFANEPGPNNGVANLGSYGNTSQASKSPASACVVTRKVCKSGLCPYQTIQSAVDGLPQTLPGHSCVTIQDSSTYGEMVTVRNFTNNGSSIAISAAPGMTPKVSTTTFLFAAFKIENSSVVLSGITIQPAWAMTYGIFVSSPNVTISSMNVSDAGGWIQTAGIVLSSWTTVSYTTVTVYDAHGFYLPYSTMSTVSYSTAINNSASKYPVYLENASSNTFTVLFASNSDSGGYALWAQNSDTNTVTRSYLWSGLRSVALVTGSDYNTISLSTMIGNSSFGLWITGSDSNNVTQSYMWAPAAGARMDNGSDYNTVSLSTIVASTNYGMYIGDADSNNVTQSYVWGGTHGAYVDNGADLNTINFSTVIGNTGSGIWVVASDSNTVTQSYLTGGQYGAFLDAASEVNTVSLSTMIGVTESGLRISAGLNVVTQSLMRGSNSGAHLETDADANSISFSTMVGISLNGLYAASAESNTVTQSYMQGGQRGAWLNVNADDNIISLSTMIGIGATGLYGLGGEWNTVAQSRMWGGGYGAVLQTFANYNSIVLSTMISNNLNLPALYIQNTSTNSIQSSYIQGSTAAIISGSTGTIIGSCVLVATNTFGTALSISSGSVNVTVASTTLRGGVSGRSLWLNVGNNGVVSIGSVTVTGATRGLEISTQVAGFVLAIDSITFRTMTAGATAIHFLGGTFASTITLANFEDTSIGANVSAKALDSASNIAMFSHYGARTGPLYENDPSSLVGWEAGSYSGCVVTNNVGQGQRYTTISAGVAALPTTLTGHSCVVIRDTATYTSDLVTVQGFTNNGSSITITGDPSLPGRPRVRMGFVIFNASVNIVNIDVVPNVGLVTGISISSPNVTISSVNVIDSGGNYTLAGIRLSSWTTVSYTSVTVGGAYAFYLPGSTMTTISYSSAANLSGTKQAIYLENASSNTLTGVIATNNLAASGGAVRIANGGYNNVLQSSFSAVDGQFGLHLNLSTGNTISGSYISAPGGYGTRIESSHYNTISQSTTTSNLAAAGALYFTGASSNSILGVYAANPSGYGIHLNNNSKNNTISQSTAIGGGPTPYALYIQGSSSNTITGSFLASTAFFDSTSSLNTLRFSTITSAAGTYGLELSGADNNFITGSNLMTGAHLDGGSLFNTLTGNIFTQNSLTTYALYLQTASSNTVTQSFISNPLGYALILGGGAGANNNTISQTTMTSSAAGGALFLGGNENIFVQDYIADSAGYGAQLSFADYNTFQQSTITNTSAAQSAVYVSNSDENIFTQMSISNSAGAGAHLEFSTNSYFLQTTVKGSSYGIRTLQTNTGLNISLSTVTGGSAAGNAGVYLENQTSNIAISNSYVQGSTAVWLNGASTTSVNSCALVGTGANGSGLWMAGGAIALTMSSNTVLGGGQAGIALTSNSGGVINLSTNTVIARTALYGIGATALNPAATLWITSNTVIPSLNAGATTYGIFLDSLAGGATIQNNGIFYRTAGAAFNGVGAGAYGLYANASSGIRIDHNRISNPDMVTSGNYIGAAVSASPATIFKFNDLHSTGMTLTTFNLLRITGSANTVVRNNILVSSMTTSANVNNRMIVVDAASVSGFSSDYNTFFSSNSIYQAIWNGSPIALLATWVASVPGPKDANSLSSNPLWFNPGVGGEDFHPMSQGGRWNGTIFVNDSVNSPTIDRADSADAAIDEADPNGARANQGSYGQTIEASKTVLPCPITFYVRQAGDGDSLTIQGGIDSLPGGLTTHACVVIGDSGIYNENVTVQGKTFGNTTSSITIMIDPSLTVHPTVTGSFVIRNDSVNVIGIDVATAATLGAVVRNYGIFASSANINISSVSVRDPNGFILFAGVVLSSYSTLSYSSITVQGAHGLRLDGKFAAVVNSSMTSNTGLFSALFIAGSDSNTVTGSLISNPGGYGAVIDAGAKYNTISLSSMTSASGAASGLYILNSDYNRVIGGYVSNSNAFGAFLNGADNNIISQSTIASTAGGIAALNVVNSDSNTVTASMMMNHSGTAVVLDSGSDSNIISLSTMTSNIAGGYAIDFVGATYNTVTGSYMSNPLATSVRLSAGAARNTISQSTITSISGTQALYISNADYTSVTGSFISNPGGNGAIIETGSDFNTISLSTLTSGGAGNAALNINASFSNTVTGSYLSNPAGYAVWINNGSSSTLLSQSTMTSNFGTFSALAIVASASNTVVGSFMSNPSGVAAQINAGSDYNTIIRSSMTSSAPGSSALSIAASSTNVIWNSYIQGSTAVYINASTGTVINASMLVATNTVGSALALTGGSVDLSMSSNTIFPGTQGIGVYLGDSNSGLIRLSTNTIWKGQYGVYAATQQAGTALWISSNTIYPAPVATSDVFGIYLNGLTSGATIQNNAVYYRIPGSMGVNKTAALGAISSAGLLVTGNRFSNPGMVLGGSIGTAYLDGTPNTIFKFNDFHSTGTSLANGFHIYLQNSPSANLRNNIFSSSWSVTSGSGAIGVDVGSQPGFVSDFNNFFSSNSFNAIAWGLGSFQFPWASAIGRDGQSVTRHPRWKNPDAGAEDFHLLSQAGSWNGVAFANDGYTSGMIDAADYAESYANEPAPSGFRANLGSYGNTAEASKSPVGPAAPSVAGVFTSSISVSYGFVAANGYFVIASSDANFGGTIFSSATTNILQTTLAPQGLSVNTTYYMAAAAVWGDYNAFTSTVSASTLANPPLAFTPLFNSISSAAVTVAYTNNGNPAGSTYTIVLSSGSVYPNTFTGNIQMSTTAFSSPLTGLAPNTTYFAHAAGVNWNGLASAYSTLGSTATFAADPLTVSSTFSNVGFSSFTVSWSANGNPLSITTYTVSLSTDAFLTTSALFSTAPVFGPSATFTGLTGNTLYSFRVQAINHNGSATGFASLGSTQTAPITLQAPLIAGFPEVNVSSISATWGLTLGATGYNLVASLTNNPLAVFASSAPIGISATTATVIGLSPNTTYFLFVQAYGPGAATAFSAYPATATLALSPVTAVTTFTAVQITSLTVSWQANTNPIDVTSYTVVLSTGVSFPNTFSDNKTLLSTMPAGASLTASFTGLNDNTSYYLYVAAINHNGITSSYTALGGTITLISPPSYVVFDEISSNTIVASAYSPTPYFANLNRGQSGTRVARNLVYSGFHGEQWTSMGAMSTARGESAATSFNGKVYIFGGFNGGTAQNAAEVYDPAVNAWANVTLPSTIRGGHAAAVAGGKIYVVGGNTDGFTSLTTNEEYDPVTGGWTTRAALSARDHLSAVAVGNAVYAFGGVINAVASGVTERYDPATNAWTNRTAFPSAQNQMAAAAVAGPSAMFISAAGGSGPVTDNYTYDSSANSWSPVTAMPNPLEAAAAASLGGKVYVIGGAGAVLQAEQTVYEYDPASNIWTTRTNMTTGRSALSAVSAGGRIYAVGGKDAGGTALATNEEYDPGVATRFTGLSPNVQAGFKAQARNQVGTRSGETAIISTWTWAALPATDVSTFPVVAADSITFQWLSNNNPAGTTEFKARASTAASFGGGATVLSSDWGAMNSTATLALSPNTTYFFQSKARNGVGGVPGIETAFVALGSTSTLAADPTIAAVTFANITTGGMSVSWLPNGNPLGITTYTVVLSTEAVYPNSNTGNSIQASTKPAGTLPTATLGSLVANTTYFAFASAVNWNGVRTTYVLLGSTATLAIAPAASAPTYSGVSTTSVSLTWLPNTNPVDVTTYSIVLSTGSTFNSFAGNVAFSTTPAGAFPTGTSPATLLPNTTYFGYAAALNWNGAFSAYTALGSTSTLAATPATAVTTFSAVQVTSFTVSWNGNGNAIGITTYTVMLSTASDFNAFATSVTFTTAPVAGPSASFTGLTGYTQYFFQVRAINHGGSATAFTSLGSTTTLVAPLAVPLLAGFVSVDKTSVTATWGLVTGATGYTFIASLLPANPPVSIAASSTTFSIVETTAAAFAPPLSPNTSYFLFVQANGPLTSSAFAAYGATSTLANTPDTVASTFSAVSITSITVSWSANGNALAITTYTVQVSTASDFNAFATSFTITTTSVLGTSAHLTGLSGNTSYYLRVRALNHNGVASAYINLGSTLTVVSPTFPGINNFQTGDAAWRRTNSGLYQVYFQDTTGFHLDKFQVSASTTAGGLGNDVAPLTDVIIGLNPADIYNTPWALPASVFNSLIEGVTNYITVKVFNGPPLNNSTVLQDAFYVQKDTTSPVIVDTQTGDDVARFAAGTTYTVGVNDPSSGLAAFQYSASLTPGTGNAALIGWTNIAAVANTTSYTTPWTVNFPLLVSGATNYISVRSWDVAGATTTVVDAFYIQKDTTGPTVGITTPQNSSYNSSLNSISGTAASIFGVQGTEVSIQENPPLGNYYNPAPVNLFNSASPIMIPATGTTAWTLAPGITWTPGMTYRAVARSSTTSNFYSTTYATATFVMDLSTPSVGVLAPVPDSIVAVLPVISGTALDPAPSPSGLTAVEVRLRNNATGEWWNWFTQAWQPVAVSSIAAGTTAWSLSPTKELISSLEDGTSYFIAVRASDNALPSNQGDFFVSGATFTWLDTTPPSPIGDLAAVSGVLPGQILLNWTAMGDDAGIGFVADGEYRIFYSTDIAAVPSTTTAQVVITTADVNAGDLQSYLITGLNSGVTYYVAVALADSDVNWSLFSNIASTIATPTPINAITGHVVDISTIGITAVQVDCWNAADALVGTTFTLADGSGTYTVNGLPPGNYKLRVTWTVNGFSSSLWQDGIPMGSSNVDFFLNINYALATLTGTLSTLATSSFGAGGLGVAAVSGSYIELYQQGREVAQVNVQPNGKWTIGGLLPGSYAVRAYTSLGYTSFQNVELGEGEVRVLGFAVNPLPEASVFAFPNPARTSTTIRFETALSPFEAGILIFDLAGNLVKEIPDSQISRVAAPVYRATWDLDNSGGRAVASGVYNVMVTIRGGNDNQTAKVIKKVAVVR